MNENYKEEQERKAKVCVKAMEQFTKQVTRQLVLDHNFDEADIVHEDMTVYLYGETQHYVGISTVGGIKLSQRYGAERIKFEIPHYDAKKGTILVAMFTKGTGRGSVGRYTYTSKRGEWSAGTIATAIANLVTRETKTKARLDLGTRQRTSAKALLDTLRDCLELKPESRLMPMESYSISWPKDDVPVTPENVTFTFSLEHFPLAKAEELIELLKAFMPDIVKDDFVEEKEE